MQKYVDDSELTNILKDAKKIMAGIGGKKEMDRQDLLEMAQRIARNTNSYAGIGSGSVTHFVEKSARDVKSKIGTHIEMLKTTASNISLMKERIPRRPGLHKSSFPEVPLQLDPVSGQLGDYNRKIDEALKCLSSKTGGKTMIEQKVKQYREIIGDVERGLKELPKALKEGGKMENIEAIDQKLIEKVNRDAAEMLKKMQDETPRESMGWKREESGSDEEDEEETRDWVNYEGFNSQEDLDQYNEMFKRFVGEYPDEYEKINKEEGYYDKDGMGRAIDRSKPGNPRRRDSPPNKEEEEQEAMERCIQIQMNLRKVLSKSKENGDLLGRDLLCEKKFLDDYMEKKMDSIHTGEGFLAKEEVEQKKSTQKTGTRKKNEETAEEGRLCLDGPPRKGTVESSKEKPRSSHAKTNIKSFVPLLSGNSSNDKKRPETPARPKTCNDKIDLSDSSISWDMDRIKKLIEKERQDQLRKKREDWERNNELSEAVLDREKMKELKKKYKCGIPKSPFDAAISDSKPCSSDFITNREKHEKLYRKAAKGREGVYHKEDLEYEFGVSPYYYEPTKNKKEGGDSKDTAVIIKSYRGVRKKTES